MLEIASKRDRIAALPHCLEVLTELGTVSDEVRSTFQSIARGFLEIPLRLLLLSLHLQLLLTLLLRRGAFLCKINGMQLLLQAKVLNARRIERESMLRKHFLSPSDVRFKGVDACQGSLSHISPLIVSFLE